MTTTTLPTPAAQTPAPRRRRSDPLGRRCLDLTEYRLLLDAVPDRRTRTGCRDFLMIRLMGEAGLRVSEMLAVTPNMFRVEGDVRRLHLPAEITKGARPRSLTIGSNLWGAVAAWKLKAAIHDAAAPMFRISRVAAWRRVKRLARRAGLQGVSPHTLRHSFASIALQNGASLVGVKTALGHASISTTSIYLHVLNAGEAEIAVSIAIEGTPTGGAA